MKQNGNDYRDRFVRSLTEEEWEAALADVEETDYILDPEQKEAIQRKTWEKQPFSRMAAKRKRRNRIRYGLVAAAAFVFLLVAIPSPVHAWVQRMWSLIPSVGMTTNDGKHENLVGIDTQLNDPNHQLMQNPLVFTEEGMLGFIVTHFDSERYLDWNETKYVLRINGKEQNAAPDARSTLGYGGIYLFLDTPVQSGDQVELTVLGDVTISVKMQPTDALDEQKVAVAHNGKGIVWAAVEDAGESWNIHLTTAVEGGRVLRFEDGFGEADVLTFKADGGQQLSMELPYENALGKLNPVKVPKDDYREGQLVVPYLEYTTDEQVEISAPMPKDGETLAVEKTFDAENGSITVKQVRREENRMIWEIELDGKEDLLYHFHTDDVAAGFGYWNASDAFHSKHLTAMTVDLPEEDLAEMSVKLNTFTYRIEEDFVLDLTFGE